METRWAHVAKGIYRAVFSGSRVVIVSRTLQHGKYRWTAIFNSAIIGDKKTAKKARQCAEFFMLKADATTVSS